MSKTSSSDPAKPTSIRVTYVTFDSSTDNLKYNNHDFPHLRTISGSQPVTIDHMMRKYSVQLEIVSRQTSPYSYNSPNVAAIKMIPLFPVNDESKDWTVKFSILDIINQEVTKQPSYFAVDAWICPNLIEVNSLLRRRELIHDGKLRIGVEVNFDAGKIKTNLPAPSNVPKCCALDDFGRLFDEQILTDVTLNICGKEVQAHKAILAVRSSVFAAMFEHEMIEKKQNKVDVADMDFEVFTEMLRFIYTGSCRNIATKTNQLLAAADMYDLERLKMMCEIELCKNITVENAIDVLRLADLHGAARLKIQAINFFTSHATDVMATAGYDTMKNSYPHLMEEILRAMANNTGKQLESKAAQLTLLSEL